MLFLVPCAKHFCNISALKILVDWEQFFSGSNQCSKWDGMCRYTIQQLLFVPEFHTDTYRFILYPYICFHFYDYIFVSLLRSSIPALLNFHFVYCFEPVIVISCCMFWEACTNVYIECLTMSVNVTQFVHLAVQGSVCHSSSSLDSTWKMMWSQWRRGPQAWHYVADTDLYC
jgi:hypothetical protein